MFYCGTSRCVGLVGLVGVLIKIVEPNTAVFGINEYTLQPHYSFCKHELLGGLEHD